MVRLIKYLDRLFTSNSQLEVKSVCLNGNQDHLEIDCKLEMNDINIDVKVELKIENVTRIVPLYNPPESSSFEKGGITEIENAVAHFLESRIEIRGFDHLENVFLKDCIFVRSNGFLIKLNLEDIIFFEADANYSQLNTKVNKFLIRSSLRELERKLKKNTFVRIHKSFIINLEAIESIHPDFVIIQGKDIPISRNQYSKLIRQIQIV